MAATIFIGLILLIYVGFVVKRKVTDVKNGKFCSCNCEGCSGKCGKPHKNKVE